ncbi:MAG: hypothetical protein ABIY48_03010 [Acidimicrobiales bacterium]
MKRLLSTLSIGLLLTSLAGPAEADVIGDDGQTTGIAETVNNAVRVTVVLAGGTYSVEAVHGAGTAQQGCRWTLLFTPELSDAPYGTSPGPRPDPDARFALLLCDGVVARAIWVAPSDVVDLDAVARTEAARYVRNVLTPAVSIGVNPSAKGLAGLRSWFWIDGFSGSVTAPPISAFGLTIEVRMSSRSVTWDFGDGTVQTGDLGRAYPEESTVQHAHQRAGSFVISATITLAPEYRIGGGPWLALPNLTAVATTTHRVEQRQPVVTDA